ncbi:MAG: AAA family ATPase [Bacteroidota bacterium]
MEKTGGERTDKKMELNNLDVEEMKIPDIFSNYDDDIHHGKLFVSLYKAAYSTYSVYKSINVELLLKNLEQKFNIKEEDFLIKDEYSKSKKIDQLDYNQCNYLIKIKDKLLLFIANYKAVFYYAKDVEFEQIQKIIDILKQSRKEKKHKKKFYMVSRNNHSEYGFDFRRFNIKKQDIDIATNYNDDFIEVNSTINGFLNTNKSNGLILLHGKYGTGKTSYIRNLMNTVNKRFIFLPLDMMDTISNPNFLPFISQYRNSVLVLEDCETLIKPRDGGRIDNALVNLLNLGDGLLSDALAIKIVCTFNADLKQIDQAILRKGRLIARYEFKELKSIKAKALALKLGIKSDINKSLTLAEIYNLEKKDFSKLNSDNKIGF